MLNLGGVLHGSMCRTGVVYAYRSSRRRPTGENAEIRHTCDVVPCPETQRMVHSHSESGNSLLGWRRVPLARFRVGVAVAGSRRWLS